MERSGNFYKAIRLGYILISILIGCMAYNSLYEWQEIEALELGNKKIDELRKEINNINIQMIKFSLLGVTILKRQHGEDRFLRSEKHGLRQEHSYRGRFVEFMNCLGLSLLREPVGKKVQEENRCSLPELPSVLRPKPPDFVIAYPKNLRQRV